MQEKVGLRKSQVLSDIESGMGRKEIAEKYGLPAAQMNKAISLMGLSGVRAKKVMFEIIDDGDDENTPEFPPVREDEEEVVERVEMSFQELIN